MLLAWPKIIDSGLEAFFFFSVPQLSVCVSVAVGVCHSSQSYQRLIRYWDRPAETTPTENSPPSLPDLTKSICTLQNRYTHAGVSIPVETLVNIMHRWAQGSPNVGLQNVSLWTAMDHATPAHPHIWDVVVSPWACWLHGICPPKKSN